MSLQRSPPLVLRRFSDADTTAFNAVIAACAGILALNIETSFGHAFGKTQGLEFSRGKCEQSIALSQPRSKQLANGFADLESHEKESSPSDLALQLHLMAITDLHYFK